MFVIEDLPISAIEVNDKLIIVSANSMAYDLFGYKAEELIGKNIDILVPVESRQKHEILALEFFKNPYPKKLGIGRDLMGMCKNGSYIPIEIGLYPENGNIVAFIVDITIRNSVKVNEELKFLAKNLSQTLDKLDNIE